MPDRDKETQDARNRATLLNARTPPGFPDRVKAEAKARGMSVGAFLAEVVTPELRHAGDGEAADPETGDQS